MVEVPYRPYPTTAPIEDTRRGGRIDIHTPEAAFGGAVAHALEGLGATEEKAGGELFQRAIAIQDLKNETEAREADANYVMQQGQLRANFESLQGKAAVDAQRGYFEQSNALRKQIRDGLSNPAAQRMYDSTSLGFMSRNIFSASMHAATQFKQWQVHSNQAEFSAAADAVGKDPFNAQTYKDGVARINSAIDHEVSIGVLDPGPTAEAEKNKRISALSSEQIVGAAKSHPFQAKALLNDAIKDGKIRGEDIARISNFVDGQVVHAGARNITRDLWSGSGVGYGSGPVDLGRAQDAIGTIESGNRYDNITDSKTKLGRALGRYQVMEGELQDQLKSAGLPSMTPDAFLKDHAAQDQLFAHEFGGLMKKYGNFNDAASAWFTGRPLAQARAEGAHDRFIGVDEYIHRANAQLAKNAPLQEKLAKGQDLAQHLDPDNEDLKTEVRRTVSTRESEERRITTQTTNDNLNTVWGGISGEGGQKKLPTTVEELQQDPKAAAAYDALDEAGKRKVRDALTKNAKEDYVASEDAFKRFQTLRGMARNVPAGFLDQDPMNEKLPRAWRGQLMQLQQQVLKGAEQDPRTTRAMKQLEPILTAAGLTAKQDPEGFNQFTGALEDELLQSQGEGKRPPTFKEVQEIGARLLQQQITSKGFIWDSKAPLYGLSVPSEVSDKIKADPAWKKLGIEPTDEQIRRIYVRERYQQLYGKTGE